MVQQSVRQVKEPERSDEKICGGEEEKVVQTTGLRGRLAEISGRKAPTILLNGYYIP